MSTDYIWTAVGWVLAVVGYGGVFAWLVWGAFAAPVEDEEAAR